MNALTLDLLKNLNSPSVLGMNVIPWSSPVPCFGDLSRSRVATLGLNPSNREFVDSNGTELDGEFRRFPTLSSLGLKCWSDVNEDHLNTIAVSCNEYFERNPYDGWFKKLEYIIAGADASYYDAFSNACHLDLIPYATACKWSELNSEQRKALFDLSKETLASLLSQSSVQVLILNGNAVVEQFQKLFSLQLQRTFMPKWSLARGANSNVLGYSYSGTVVELQGVKLRNKLLILGYNHNIQSSFGVTKVVATAIRQWIKESTTGITI